jgi:hypothetical protein
VGDVIVKSHKQNSVAINFVDSNEEINKGHMQLSVLSSRRRVTASISNNVDTIYSCDEQVSRVSINQFMFVCCRATFSHTYTDTLVHQPPYLETRGWGKVVPITSYLF